MKPCHYPLTYAEAMELLDARRLGADMPESVVLKALELTGDYQSQARYAARTPLFLVDKE